ncbi:hypothetical protein CYY_001003 [Polysphondylium violaceum]|uniref:Uncharacterized protein n=1 Tax=Polysphondylium violaceum TaxID=133409 RepID=A0A8J4V8C7_9MYCE|nr:hypothetical protein CYY_001003 [Polysphondylium violaceum]
MQEFRDSKLEFDAPKYTEFGSSSMSTTNSDHWFNNRIPESQQKKKIIHRASTFTPTTNNINTNNNVKSKLNQTVNNIGSLKNISNNKTGNESITYPILFPPKIQTSCNQSDHIKFNTPLKNISNIIATPTTTSNDNIAKCNQLMGSINRHMDSIKQLSVDQPGNSENDLSNTNNKRKTILMTRDSEGRSTSKKAKMTVTFEDQLNNSTSPYKSPPSSLQKQQQEINIIQSNPNTSNLQKQIEMAELRLKHQQQENQQQSDENNNNNSNGNISFNSNNSSFNSNNSSTKSTIRQRFDNLKNILQFNKISTTSSDIMKRHQEEISKQQEQQKKHQEQQEILRQQNEEKAKQEQLKRHQDMLKYQEMVRLEQIKRQEDEERRKVEEEKRKQEFIAIQERQNELQRITELEFKKQQEFHQKQEFLKQQELLKHSPPQQQQQQRQTTQPSLNNIQKRPLSKPQQLAERKINVNNGRPITTTTTATLVKRPTTALASTIKVEQPKPITKDSIDWLQPHQEQHHLLQKIQSLESKQLQPQQPISFTGFKQPPVFQSKVVQPSQLTQTQIKPTPKLESQPKPPTLQSKLQSEPKVNKKVLADLEFKKKLDNTEELKKKKALQKLQEIKRQEEMKLKQLQLKEKNRIEKVKQQELVQQQKQQQELIQQRQEKVLKALPTATTKNQLNNSQIENKLKNIQIENKLNQVLGLNNTSKPTTIKSVKANPVINNINNKKNISNRVKLNEKQVVKKQVERKPINNSQVQQQQQQQKQQQQQPQKVVKKKNDKLTNQKKRRRSITIPISPLFSKKVSTKDFLNSIANEITKIANNTATTTRQERKRLSIISQKWKSKNGLTKIVPFQFQCDLRFGEIPLSRQVPINRDIEIPSGTPYKKLTKSLLKMSQSKPSQMNDDNNSFDLDMDKIKDSYQQVIRNEYLQNSHNNNNNNIIQTYQVGSQSKNEKIKMYI